MARDTKQRMVEAAAGLLRRRGLAATSFTDVIKARGAARGAIYHHFPDGKDELAELAVAWTGRRVRDHFAALEASDTEGVLRGFVALIRPIVAQAAAGTSCAVAAVAAEATPGQTALTAAASEAFQSWMDVLAERMRRVGLSPVDAAAAAQLMIAFLEGSLVLARATGDVASFEDSARALVRAGQALDGPPPSAVRLD